MKTAREQFDYIYTAYAKEVFNIAYGYTKNKEDSKDIVQNSYLKLLSVGKKFNTDEEIKYYLIRIVINESINFLKSSYNRLIVKDNSIVDRIKDTDEEENNEQLIQAINILPNKYKTIIILYYYNQTKIKEIAGILKISEDAVKKRLERARQKIKEIMERNK